MRRGVRRAAWPLALLLAGCTAGPDWERPRLWTPASWFRAGPDAGGGAAAGGGVVPEPPDPRWWASFGDPVLTDLMGRVAAGNLDVRAASAEVLARRAGRGGAQAEAVARLDLGASYERRRLSDRGLLRLLDGDRAGDVPARGRGGFDLFRTGLGAAWELDLWGRVRRATEAAEAELEASREDRRDVLLAGMAEVARAYLRLRVVQGMRRAVDDALERSLPRPRPHRGGFGGGFGGGPGDGLLAARLDAEAAALRAEAAGLEREEGVLANRVALLLGQPPGTLRRELAPAPPPLAPARVPVGLPAELTRRRPDIRAAEARLHAATAGIGVAEASFFPSVTLSGTFELQALRLGDLGWGARAFGIGPALRVPLFEGPRLRAVLELRQAEQQAAAVAYQAAVLRAFHDVDDALAGYRAARLRREALAAAEAARRRALDLAARRGGPALPEARRELLEARLRLVEAEAAVPAALVDLFTALGGGWEEAFPPAPNPP